MSGRRRVGLASGAGLLAAGAVGGAVLAGTMAANASTPTTPSSSSNANTPQQPNVPEHGSAAHEDAEMTVTGINASKARAAAVKSVGSGSTAGAVTSDFTGSGYEVTVTKTDGSLVEVHMDNSFTVMDHGGPGDGTHDGPQG